MSMIILSTVFIGSKYRSLSNDTPHKKDLNSVNAFTKMVNANRRHLIFFLESFIFQYVFNIKLVPGIVLSTMGFVVTLPDIVPRTFNKRMTKCITDVVS